MGNEVLTPQINIYLGANSIQQAKVKTMFSTESIIASIFVGSLYSLMALGLTMTYASSKFPSFCHASMITIGAYVSAILSRYTNFGISVIVAVIFTSCFNGMIYKFIIIPFVRRAVGALSLMVISFAVGLIIRKTITIIAESFHWLHIKSMFVSKVFQIYGVGISNLFVITVTAALVVMTVFELFIKKTKVGKKMRAAVSNSDLALVCGIDVEKTATLSWIIAGGMAGLAGALWSSFSYAYPDLGFLIFPMFFAASIIGGLTSLSGTIIGGYTIGFSENVIMEIIHNSFGISVLYKPLISFMIITIVLLIKPTGVAGISLSKIRQFKKVVKLF